MAKNSSSFYRYGLCSKNIDKAVANFKESNELDKKYKNTIAEVQKENKEIVNPNKIMAQGPKPSISTPISHVEKLNNSRKNEPQPGHSK